MKIKELIFEADDVAPDEGDANETVETRVYTVPLENLPRLQMDIEKLNKKCAKLGSPPIVVKYGEKVMKKVRSETGPDEFREFQSLTIEGQAPKLNGWTFVGKLENLDGVPIVKAIPGMTIPERYKNAPIHCEHCKKKVRRNDTFIVKKGKSTYKQVGRSCLKDFLGHKDPANVAAMAEFFKTLDEKMSEYEDPGKFGSGRPLYSMEHFLDVAFAVIERDKGFRPKSFDKSTGEGMRLQLWPPRDPKYQDPILPITPQNKADTAAAINWLMTTKAEDKSDFWQNLIKFVQAKLVPGNVVGFAAAFAGMYLKERDNIVHVKKQKAEISDEPIAAVGTKLKFKATVLSAFRYQGRSFSYYDSGIKQVLTMKTADNKLLKMFSGNLDIKKGDEVEISGVIGKHEVETYEKSPFKDKMITMMAPRSRIKIIGQPPQSPADREAALGGVVSIQGQPPPESIRAIQVDQNDSDQRNITLIMTPDVGQPIRRTFKRDEVVFKT